MTVELTSPPPVTGPQTGASVSLRVVWLTAVAGTGLSLVFVVRHMPWIGVVMFAHTLLFVALLRAGMKRPAASPARAVRHLVFLLAVVVSFAPEMAASLKNLV